MFRRSFVIYWNYALHTKKKNVQKQEKKRKVKENSMNVKTIDEERLYLLLIKIRMSRHA